MTETNDIEQAEAVADLTRLLGVQQPEPLTLDYSGVSAAMIQALHKAQQQAEAAPKAGWNEHSRYKYATAESVIEAANKAMAGTGLVVQIMWGQPQPPRAELEGIDIGRNRVGSYLPIEFAMLHSDGETFGIIRGRTGIDVLVDPRRPPDKAVQAGRTYAHGFILVSLLNLPRGEVDADVDQRNDEDHPQQRRHQRAQAQQQRQAAPKGPAPVEVARGAFRAYQAAAEAAGVEPYTIERVAAEAGIEGFRPSTATAEQWSKVIPMIRQNTEGLQALAAQADRETEDGDEDPGDVHEDEETAGEGSPT